MLVFNVMFGRGLGGIEQSMLDYHIALSKTDTKVVSFAHPDAKILKKFAKAGIPSNEIIKLKNMGQWDVFAKILIAQLLKKFKPDAVIAHGNRAINLFHKACKKHNVPLIGVTHNYKLQHFHKCDAAFAITENLAEEVRKEIGTEHIFNIPHMINIAPHLQPPPKPFANPPIIGVMSRMVPEKGLELFLRALEHLKSHHIEFKAKIGGDGDERKNLEDLIQELGLGDYVELLGWQNDKADFYSSIDIFCLPSLRESFGIVILEAYKAALPIVSTRTHGPNEIIHHNFTGILTEVDIVELAEGLEKLIKDEKLAHKLGKQGYEYALANFCSNVIGKKIRDSISEITQNHAKLKKSA
ncbi:MAG: glycosyl transferase family 1 [Alphaproteobacteria bacterium CG11_big_fil_rev_8_21_14_0_20_44_7]|nr:MAG: glycosyl transferase family 1 [Alphaproteobacteria bacterium CG11_big_fil_rev_8_21_14_0_20_44_7]